MNKKIVHFLTALAIYTAFALYLYYPYLNTLTPVHYLSIAALILASTGCFLISTRWILHLAPSIIAGAVYGFGPLCLSLLRYHPSISILAASIPWLFIPSVFGPKANFKWLRVPLAMLPFAIIILFFHLSAKQGLFAIPINVRLNIKDLPSLIFPLVMIKRRLLVIGIYHLPIAGLIIGFSMMIKARRFSVLLILIASVVLSCVKPFLSVSPIIWSTVALMCCAVITAEGFQGLISAGNADKKWILVPSIVLMALSLSAIIFIAKCQSIFAIPAIQYQKIFTYTAKIYILGAIALAILFLITHLKLRLQWLRWLLLIVPAAIDIFLGAKFIFDNVI